LKIITGFNEAKAALSRQKLTDSSNPELMRKETDVRKIIEDVQKRGDAAIREWTLNLDGVEITSLEVTGEQVASAYQQVDEELMAALKLAAERISSFHEAQKHNMCNEITGSDAGQMIRPLERVGVYVPGGTASYPSTVLMTAIPARAAGVKEIVLTTPPKSDGTVPPEVLVAADIAGVDRIFRIGGAQAIAALAFGTDSIPAVDKICGPGNIYVMLAKKMVFGTVGIDGLQGPSEVLIIADETANPEYCAADLLAQAEHDKLASATLVTTSQKMADEVNKAVALQLESLPRRDIAAESLKNGMIAVVDNLDEAIELANLYAPEHLCLMIADAASYLDRIQNAGCVIAGRNATVVLGDYVAGPSHALPTGGTARFSSPLSVSDFIKLINVVTVDEAGWKQLGPAASVIARAEGFDAHARAIEKRLKSSS